MLWPLAEKLAKFILLFIGTFARLFGNFSESIESLLLLRGNPLADRSFCDARHSGDIHLFHATFKKFHRPQPN
jgi:hypothetical protein